MGAYLFLLFMSVWLLIIAGGCLAARARLRREDRTAAGSAALLTAMTRIPCLIPVGPRPIQLAELRVVTETMPKSTAHSVVPAMRDAARY